jgi:ATP-dependent Lon protease
MPAKSKAQQTAMCMALAARKGDLEVSKLKGAALDIYNSDMTNKEIEEFTVMENNLKIHLTNNLPNILESIFMKELKNYINEQLNQNITESKKNPLLKKEIKTDEFEIGDIVLFKDFIEAGDEDDIMVVVEPLGDRCDVEHIGTLSI